MPPAPEFIIAGSAKSGTTALHFMLDQHPDVFMSPIKETNFFIHGYESTRHFVGLRGERVLEGQDESDIVDTHDKYAELFAQAPAGVLRGEASPWYLINRKVPARILDHRPDTKIVIILRDPADVAFANFVHLVRDRAESLRLGQIDRVFDENRYASPELYPFCDHLSLPRYGKHLPAWLEAFDPANVHLMIYEEFKADRRGHLSRLHEFLGLRDDVDIDVERKVNVSGMPRSEALQSFLQGGMLFKKIVGLVVPKKPRRKVRAMIEAMNTGSKVQMSASTRSRFDAIYRHDVAFVESVFERAMTVWDRN